MPPPLIPAERDRSKDRDRMSSGGSSSGAMSFLPSIFGRRPAPPATTRTTASKSQLSDRQRGREEHTSPRSSPLTLAPSDSTDATRRAPSPAPFHLDSVLGLLQSGTQSTAELAEVVKATAVWLLNRLMGDEDVFEDGQKVDKGAELSKDNVKFLYDKATEFAQPEADYNLRIAAIRLFAALLATTHPAHGDDHLAGSRQMREIYRLITIPSSPQSKPSSAAKVDAILVEIGALRALTENGTNIHGLDGILGWTVQTLADITDDWVAWCGKKSDAGVDWSGEAKIKVSQFCVLRIALTGPRISHLLLFAQRHQRTQ